MTKIVRIHEKIFKHLLRLRSENSTLFFVPRRINNHKRLENGYWFIGNEYYLQVSFWNGTDWKEKIHNIGFVVSHTGKSYIELSAQDSAAKASFLKHIADQIDGFKKDGSKNKWYLSFSGTDYVANLDEFIENIKPKIDAAITNSKPEGITLLDASLFNRYLEKVNSFRDPMLQYGKANKIARICWNTNGWKFPSGSEGKSTAKEAHEARNGFGFEEWLLDKSRIVDGFHYSFLQPLFVKSGKHVGKSYNISLYTINNLQCMYYIGQIKSAVCISQEESAYIHSIYSANGWLDEMAEAVKMIGGNQRIFNQTKAEELFNIKFEFENIVLEDEMLEISDSDGNITTQRYKLLPQKGPLKFALFDSADDDQDDSGGEKRKNTKTRRRVFKGECEYDPYHDMMQNEIYDVLKESEEYDSDHVYMEKGRVDIKAKTKQGAWHYFELKTDSAKISIRKALGQILEYAYYPTSDKAEKLIIIADDKPNAEVINYLDHIREKFGFPITYRYFDFASKFLSEDF